MKKITLLLSLFLVGVYVNAQTNLLLNPGFETWTDGKTPDNWELSTTGTPTKSTTALTELSALQVAATGTYWVTQVVSAPNGTTFDPSKKYEFSLNYKITAGDKTDLRVWHGFITSDPGVTPTAYYPVPKTSADSAAYYWPFHGPDGKTSTTGYWGYDAADTNWKSYSYSFNFPEGIKQFSYQIRVYKNATVILDDVYFGESRTSNVKNAGIASLKVWSSNGKVMFNAAQGEKVEVFNAVGQRVLSTQAAEGENELAVSSKGVTIVRVGTRTGKVIL